MFSTIPLFQEALPDPSHVRSVSVESQILQEMSVVILGIVEIIWLSHIEGHTHTHHPHTTHTKSEVL